jgi:flagellar protein FliL
MAQVQELEPDEVGSDAGSDATANGPEAKAPRNKKKLVIIGAAVAVLLLVGGGASYALLGESESEGESAGGSANAGAGPETFIDIPPMTVNLRSADGTPRFLRVHLMLVPVSADKQEEITQKLPLIIDAYQPFLRELRPEDLAGSAAAFRLKEEMLIRANREVGADSVADVLIQDLVQQ